VSLRAATPESCTPFNLSPRQRWCSRATATHFALACAGSAIASRSPVLFGGVTVDDEPVLTEMIGTRTRALHGLTIRPSPGLGGRVLVPALLP
ncbi:MAG: hypothetical protein ACXWXC_09500, partial [Aeromicrobium sp.]